MAEKVDEFFCWIRVIKLSTGAREAQLDRARIEPEQAQFASGSRPPPPAPNASPPPEDLRQQDARSLLVGAPPGYFGREGADTGFDLGPIFRTEAKAIEWLFGAGRSWDADAANRFLLRVDTPREAVLKRFDPAAASCTPPQVPPASNPPFADDDWNPVVRWIWCAHRKRDTPRTAENATLGMVTLPPLPGPESFQVAGHDEAAELSSEGMLQERVAHLPTILRDAYSVAAAGQRVIDALGTDLPVDRPQAVRAWRDWLIDAVEAPIFHHKLVYRRARPATLLGGRLPQLFPKDHWLHPGHPSYPAGHATVAYTLAFRLMKRFPSRAAALLEAAADVSRNRERAGLHFRSDTMGGMALAAQVSNLLDAPTLDASLQPERDLFVAALG